MSDSNLTLLNSDLTRLMKKKLESKTDISTGIYNTILYNYKNTYIEQTNFISTLFALIILVKTLDYKTWLSRRTEKINSNTLDKCVIIIYACTFYW